MSNCFSVLAITVVPAIAGYHIDSAISNLSRSFRGLVLTTAFQLIAGHPALDLVNTLDWRFAQRQPLELLTSYEDLLRFTEQSKLLTARQARQLGRSSSRRLNERTLRRSIDLREALADIFYAPSPAALKTLQRYFQAARRQQKLAWKGSHLEWKWPAAENADLPFWTLAMSASDLMTSEAAGRVRACGNPDCHWLFLDTSKNHSRRWCDMKLCGNRMKARRFKAQQRA
jgi:predicted RNA-binding Zn ribbon-like protein